MTMLPNPNRRSLNARETRQMPRTTRPSVPPSDATDAAIGAFLRVQMQCITDLQRAVKELRGGHRTASDAEIYRRSRDLAARQRRGL